MLHEDVGGEGFGGDAWRLIEEDLHERGPLEGDRLRESVGRLLIAEGWRDADGLPIAGWALVGALHPVLCLAEGYGLLRRSGTPSTVELTAAGHSLAASELPPARRPPRPSPATPRSSSMPSWPVSAACARGSRCSSASR